MPDRKTLIVIGGPTAVGKSAVALALAQHYNAEIVNADSRQVYAELKIGVNKPSKEDTLDVPHHLIGHVSIQQEYNVGLFERDALKAIHSIFQQKNIAVLVGGTGLYVKAVVQGLDVFPTIPPSVKEEVKKLHLSNGLQFLQNKLIELDPEYSKEVDIQNPMRILRALEVIFSSGEKYSTFRAKINKNRDFVIIPMFIDKDRKELYKIIDLRVDQMMNEGLKEEALSLLPFKHLKALQTVGYAEWFEHFDGRSSETETLAKIKQHTRNYAKRQWTWWKPWAWAKFESNQIDLMRSYIDPKL